jgi:hypothetical protein
MQNSLLGMMDQNNKQNPKESPLYAMDEIRLYSFDYFLSAVQRLFKA